MGAAQAPKSLWINFRARAVKAKLRYFRANCSKWGNFGSSQLNVPRSMIAPPIALPVPLMNLLVE